MTVSFSDLTELDHDSLTREHGLQQSQIHFSKFIGKKGLVIAARTDQEFSESFWKGYLSHKSIRLKRLPVLELNGLSENSALHLAKVMHDLDIKPRKILFDGKDVDE